MQRTLIVDALASAQPQTSLTVCGWIRTRRDAKGFCFVELNDGSCLANLQCIVDEGTPAHAALGDASTGASLAVTGELALKAAHGLTPLEHAGRMPEWPDGKLPTIVPMSTEAADMLRESADALTSMGFGVDLDSNADELPAVVMPGGVSGKMIPGSRKVYPNDPCPCGSGKKYKKCCGKK